VELSVSVAEGVVRIATHAFGYSWCGIPWDLQRLLEGSGNPAMGGELELFSLPSKF